MCAVDRDGLQGAKRSNSRSYCEQLQRGRPPEAADAHGAVICSEDPWCHPKSQILFSNPVTGVHEAAKNHPRGEDFN